MLVTPTVSQIPTDRETVFAFRLGGHARTADVSAMARLLIETFEGREKGNLLIDLEGAGIGEAMAGMEPDEIWSGDFRLSSVHHYALVGEPEAVEATARLFAELIPTEPRTFAPPDIEGAWSYVCAEPTGVPSCSFGQTMS